ncbi:MAG: VanW family protein [Oscillospiraceae bacterium]|jgi:hypothetical protein|nr:VanW family protein [Oscillospiraceae bacterium]
MRRLALLLALLLLLGSMPARAEETMPEALWAGRTRASLSVRPEMRRDAPVLYTYAKGQRVFILDYTPEWLKVVYGDAENFGTGYVLRHMVEDVKTVKSGAEPYGMVKNTYVAVVAKDTLLRTQPDAEGAVLCGLAAGSRVAIESIENGWARIPYWRQVGYVYVGELADLTPIYEADEAQPGDVISAFTTFFAFASPQLTINRAQNIATACRFISHPIAPGERFDFAESTEPYTLPRGYAEAVALFDGGTGTGMGGGVCQVSSTLYNVLLSLDGGIEVLLRRPHGPNGATYLPHGVDAAVGNETLNLIFRNTHRFPVRIDASAHNGVLYIAMLRE